MITRAKAAISLTDEDALDGVVYRCFRGTGIPVYNRLADLVGIYVEVV